MAQLVKNPLQCRRPGFDSLGWEHPLEKGKAIHIMNSIKYVICSDESFKKTSIEFNMIINRSANILFFTFQILRFPPPPPPPTARTLFTLLIFSINSFFKHKSGVKPQYIKVIKEKFVSIMFVRFQCIMLTYKTQKKEQWGFVDEHRKLKSVLRMTAAGFSNFSFQFIPFCCRWFFFFNIVAQSWENNLGSLKKWVASNDRVLCFFFFVLKTYLAISGYFYI